ncbi:CoA transferase [Saxibacter everestensis]|uniref:CoA transferase n=1 Tax=Saxibacter everestensis TaxID=2909229 RepID=A0ABY8QY18_9MICO|nr:CoA transferase [Brevibacteriaceae bacterium ZFBP1038]
MTDTQTAATLNDVFGRAGTGPLSGVVIADFTRILAGPYCTMLLADMGATVIKVESPAGDDTRTWRPPLRDGEATYYLAVNRNKHSIALDLKDEDDLRVAHEIAARADVLVQNFKPGGLASFRLDYESVKGLNPEVIYASISGFGSKGGKDLPGYDLLVQGMSGLMSITGDQDGSPYKAGIAVFDVMTGMHTGMGILAALHHRTATGKGQHLDLNLMSSALSGLVNQTSAYVAGGVVPKRMGNGHPSLFPYEPLETGDGELIIAAGNDRQFRTLCDALGIPEVPADERFATMNNRNANREELRPILLERLAKRTAREWFEVLRSSGLPCAPIQDIKGGVELAEELGLDPVVNSGSGDRRVPGIRNPVDFSATPVSYDLAPPHVGESSALVRAWLESDPEH